MEQHNGLRIAVVLGTTRPGSYTGKAVQIVLDELEKQGVAFDLIDPATIPLMPPGGPQAPAVHQMQKTIRNAAGVILATPEYHGSYSSVVKLIIENLGFPSALKGKPVSLVGVAAGAIGAIKAMEHLRSVVTHVGGLALPGGTSVAHVQQAFDEQGRVLDAGAEKRIRAVPGELLAYLKRHVCPLIAMEERLRKAG